jgi:hypothetical protein
MFMTPRNFWSKASHHGKMFLWPTACIKIWCTVASAEVPKLWGAPSAPVSGALAPPGSHELFVWGTYLFWTKCRRKIKCIFGRNIAWLKYFTHDLLLVLVLAPNCKQHILLPAEVRNLCYSLAELYVISWICLGRGGHEVHETFWGGGGGGVEVH